MRFTEARFKRWVITKTRQYLYLILNKNPDEFNIRFVRNFNGWDFPRNVRRSCACASKDEKSIYFRTDYLKTNEISWAALERVIIHEVCHMNFMEHSNEFFTLYKHWSGDDFIERYTNGVADCHEYGYDRVSMVVGLPRVK